VDKLGHVKYVKFNTKFFTVQGYSVRRRGCHVIDLANETSHILWKKEYSRAFYMLIARNMLQKQNSISNSIWISSINSSCIAFGLSLSFAWNSYLLFRSSENSFIAKVLCVFFYLFNGSHTCLHYVFRHTLACSVFCDLSTKCNYKESTLGEYPERISSTILFPQSEHKPQTPNASPPLPITRTINRMEWRRCKSSLSNFAIKLRRAKDWNSQITDSEISLIPTSHHFILIG